jgi:hypothetical protein
MKLASDVGSILLIHFMSPKDPQDERLGSFRKEKMNECFGSFSNYHEDRIDAKSRWNRE